MVEVKTNLLTVVIIIGFTILLAFFAMNFATTTKDSSETVITKVNETADEVAVLLTNLTTAISDLAGLKAQELQTFRSGFYNLTLLIDEQVKLAEQDRNETAKNLDLFFKALNDSSQQTKDAIMDLNRDSNASREKQTQAFIETLEKSQNLTRANAELSLERNEIEKNQTDTVEELIQAINLTLTFPSNKTQ